MIDPDFPNKKDVCVMKIGITEAFAKRYGLSINDTAIFFSENGIYEYIDEFSDIFILKTYPYLANYIADEYGVPVVRQGETIVCRQTERSCR